MQLGVVKWFDSDKGYGFVCADDGSGDVFVHFRQIEGEGFKLLEAGEEVEFEREVGEKGARATKVRKTGNTRPVPAEEPRRGSRR